MMPQHFKKTFSIAIFSFIFFSSFLVNIANAEVTCCACTGHRISYSGERGGMRGTSGIDAVEFSCAEGNPGCETICDRDNAGWRALEEHATGEVVTCCKCRDDTRVCANVNQTCSSEALCGTTPGFMSGGMWKREPGGEINASAETTKDEASKVELIPPNLNIDIPGAGNLFGGGQIVTEGEERYFYLPYIGEYVSALYNYVLGIVGILAVVVIIFAGGIWLTAGGSPERIKTAQEYIFGAVTGVVLAFGSYLILYTINPDLVRFAAIKIKVVENMPIPEGNFSIGSENPRDPENRGENEVIARRIAEEYSINGCLFATQIGMESGWDPSAHSDCCYGLGQVHWNNARNILSRNRGEITQRHSQGCPTCPQGNATEENIGQWLMNDSEGNLIIAAILKREALRSAANPVAATAIYGMGPAAYNSYVRGAPCTPTRFSEEELLERMQSEANIDTIISQSCIPLPTWPMTDTRNSTRSCPGSNRCCRSNSGTCEQPAYSPQGRIGVCQGGSRNNQRCIAVAGGVDYSRNYLRIAQRCAREE